MFGFSQFVKLAVVKFVILVVPAVQIIIDYGATINGRSVRTPNHKYSITARRRIFACIRRTCI